MNEALVTSSLFSEVAGKHTYDFVEEYKNIFFPHRMSLLTESTQTTLENGDFEKITEQLVDNLYNPFAPVSSELLQLDPLQLSTSYAQSLQVNSGRFIEKNGFLCAKDSLGHHIVISATIDTVLKEQSPASIEHSISQLITSIETPNGCYLLWNGVVRYSAFAEREATSEMSLFGTLSIVTIVILVLWAFRSIRPLVFGLIPVLIGILFAVSGTVALFGSLNVITLIFGTTLVGVSVDYGFHYLASLYWGEKIPSKRFTALTHIFPGLLLGMVTSVAGYLVLIFAPFKGLQEMAVFASFGLIGAFGAVVLLYPYFPWRTKILKEQKLFTHIKKYVQLPLFQSRATHISLLAVIILLALISLRIHGDDDIRLLKGDAPELNRIEKRFESLGFSEDKSRIIVVTGKSQTELLENEFQVVQQIQGLVDSGNIENYFAISALVPPESEQLLNQKLISDYSNSPFAEPYFQLLGITPEQCSNSYSVPKDFKSLGYEAIKESALFSSYRILCPNITEIDSSVFSLIMLQGITDGASIHTILETVPHASYVDRVGSISTIFMTFRKVAARMIMVAYLIIFLALSFRYGLLQSSKIMIPSILSTVALLSGMVVLGIAVNIFTLIAILLVLAIGLDYTLFLTETKGEYGATSNAIILSAITTALSFGLLALSSTPALATLGSTLFWGVLIVVVISPIAVSLTKGEK